MGEPLTLPSDLTPDSSPFSPIKKGIPAQKKPVGELCATNAKKLAIVTARTALSNTTQNPQPPSSSTAPENPIPLNNGDLFAATLSESYETGGEDCEKPMTRDEAAKEMEALIKESKDRRMTTPAELPEHPSPQYNVPDRKPKKPSFWQWGKNIIASVVGKKIDPPITPSPIDKIHNGSIPHYRKNIKKSSSLGGKKPQKSPIELGILEPLKTARNAPVEIPHHTIQDYRRPAMCTAAALAVSAILGGAVYELSSVGKNSSDVHSEHSSKQDVSVSRKTSRHTGTSSEFARFLWEQQNRNTQQQVETVDSTTLSATAFGQGFSTINSTIQLSPSSQQQSHTTFSLAQKGGNNIDLTKPSAQPAPLPVIQHTSQKTKTHPIQTPTADVPVGETVSSAPSSGAKTPAVSSTDSGTIKTPSSVTENTSKTAMFVISYKGKTLTIKGTHKDGVPVDTYRRELFKQLAGGNLERNTPTMYRKADQWGLKTDYFEPGHENATLTFPQIMPGVTFVTGDCTAENGETFTITANTPEALKQAVANLTRADNVAEAPTLPPLPKAETSGMDTPKTETVPNIPPKAIPLTNDELRELDSPDIPVLPMIDTTPPMSTRDQEIFNYLKRNNGVYARYSRALVPSTPKEAQEQLKTIIETWTAVNAYGMLSNQPKIPLSAFFSDHYSFCTISKDRVEENAYIGLYEMARLAGHSDLTIAKLFGDKIPPYVIDTENHNGSLETFDMQGWDQTEKLIFAAAKKKYGREPTLEDLTRFVEYEDNVSIEGYPDITYTQIFQRAIKERAEELALIAAQKKTAPPPATPTIAATPTIKDSVSPPLASPPSPINTSPPQAPKQQWAWFTIKSGANELTQLEQAISGIHQDFIVGQNHAVKELRPYQWAEESVFAKERYRIIYEETKEIISYEDALKKISTAKSAKSQ